MDTFSLNFIHFELIYRVRFHSLKFFAIPVCCAVSIIWCPSLCDMLHLYPFDLIQYCSRVVDISKYSTIIPIYSLYLSSLKSNECFHSQFNKLYIFNRIFIIVRRFHMSILCWLSRKRNNHYSAISDNLWMIIRSTSNTIKLNNKQ